MSQWAEIRHLHLVEGVAKKQIARRLHEEHRWLSATGHCKRNVAVLGWWLAAWIALPGTALVGAQPPAVEPPPSVAVIDQRLLEIATSPPF